MKSLKAPTEEKLTGKVYTPDFIVEKILNDAGYTGQEILQKYILEPACGDGQFLKEIVKRICSYSNEENILDHLSYVYAFDIDQNAIQNCIHKLNSIVLSFFPSLGVENIHWNIFCQNTLSIQNDLFSLYHLPQFDFIVGNPPYIRIQHLDKKQRKYIQQQFQFCKKGSTDIFIAFFEWAYHHLSETGKCAFITPNTYFYTETALLLRRFFENQKIIIQITNYNDLQLFPNKSTYTAITIFGKKPLPAFKYQHALSENRFVEYIIPYSQFQNLKRWNFPQIIQKTYHQHNENKDKNGNQTVKLSEIADIHVGLTTLCDKFYIVEFVREMDEKYVEVYSRLAGKLIIEKAILQPILKASRPKQWKTKKEYIIFPYFLQNGKYQIYPEEALAELFPNAYSYFLKYKTLLLQRDKGKPNPMGWYAFGRHQGLQTSFGEKILFSNMMKKPNFIYVKEKHYTFYSGYCIKLKTNELSYEALLKQLNSERMQKYVASQSRSFRNGWKAYNKKVLEDFEIFLRDIE